MLGRSPTSWTARQVRLSLGGSVYDPNDAVGRLLFNVLAMVAEFESDLIRLRTKEGMRVAKAKGQLRGKQPCQVPGLVEAGLSPADALPDGVVGVVERLVLSGWDEAEFAV
jgi:DNA invertase Pin-like site-specific DNA recombinase